MNETLQIWLNTQCQLIPGAIRALVIAQNPVNGKTNQVAVWPQGDPKYPELITAAETALEQQGCFFRTLKQSDEKSSHLIAMPLFQNSKQPIIIALESDNRDDLKGEILLKLLQSGSGWLKLLISWERPATSRAKRADDLDQGLLVELLAHTLDEASFIAAANAFVNQLGTHLTCSRVSLGMVKNKQHQVLALTHSAQLERKSNLLKAIAAAMDEARDQGISILFPELEKKQIPPITLCHQILAERYHIDNLCTVLLIVDNQAIGTVMLERPGDKPFDLKTVRFSEQAALLAAPILELKQREARWIGGRIWDACISTLSRLFGPGHLLFKLISTLIAALILFMSLMTDTYRLSADAVLEPALLRAVVAPQDGFLASALVRAGDRVNKGELLAALESKDLELERVKWRSVQDKLHKEYRSALAAHDRAKVSVLNAQISQAEAELGLLEEQLRRTRLQAPFAGLVASGDLSQSLGSPVDQGDVLFEIAPLDKYRVVLMVEESDIGDIKTGQQGHIALSAMPGHPLPIIIEKITPVAEVMEQRNRFRVEAQLPEKLQILRPGMAGKGKIEIERRRLIWIWTHRFFDWLKLQLWANF